MSIAGKSTTVRLRIFVGGEYTFEGGWLLVDNKGGTKNWKNQPKSLFFICAILMIFFEDQL